MLRRLTANRNHKQNEDGQILVAFALMLVMLLSVCGLAVDVGMMFVNRAQLVRAVDAAALAATTDLPDTTTARATAADYLNRNEPAAQLDNVSFPAEGQVRIEASKSVKLHFISLLPGIGDSAEVKAHAVAGGGADKLDIAVVLDDTGTMKQGCNGSQTNSGCPIKGERDGALELLNILGVDTSNDAVQVGLMPFRGCFMATGSNACIHEASTSALTNDTAHIQTVMGNLTGAGGSGTNLCRGLQLGEQVLDGTGTRADARKVIIMLTDGDNLYNGLYTPQNGTTEDWPGASAPSTYNCNLLSDSDSSIDVQDSKTDTLANNFAGQDIEIYVIGYGVDGPASSALCDPTQIGTGSNRHSSSDTGDLNLLKCMATSTAGSNDHFFNAPSAESLPGIFKLIAQRLSQRLVE